MGSLSLLQRIFTTQESNPGLLHRRQILYQLSYEGSPSMIIAVLQMQKLRSREVEYFCTGHTESAAMDEGRVFLSLRIPAVTSGERGVRLGWKGALCTDPCPVRTPTQLLVLALPGLQAPRLLLLSAHPGAPAIPAPALPGSPKCPHTSRHVPLCPLCRECPADPLHRTQRGASCSAPRGLRTAPLRRNPRRHHLRFPSSQQQAGAKQALKNVC